MVRYVLSYILEYRRSHNLYAIAEWTVVCKGSIDAMLESVCQLYVEILYRLISNTERITHINCGIFCVAMDIVETVTTVVIDHSSCINSTSLLWKLKFVATLNVGTFRRKFAGNTDTTY